MPPQLVESMSHVEPSMTVAEGNSQIEELVNVEPAQIDEPGNEDRMLVPEPELTREDNETTSSSGDTGNVQGQYGESLLGDGSPVEEGAVEQPQQMTGSSSFVKDLRILDSEI
ncbi:hypothetical protein V6N12_045149 [Hibiscus sabdariffa]|uniref:Uncharacterized protein n=1 Tax=Hibiscus sabdariffa TaxID=183260 RepID=A0ABR2G1X0_9ROSI